jgi:hypothetical protein
MHSYQQAPVFLTRLARDVLCDTEALLHSLQNNRDALEDTDVCVDGSQVVTDMS